MKGVETDNSKIFEWDASYCGEKWPKSHISTMLNGTNSNVNIFINNTRYEYMVEGNDWYNKIESHNWKYGNLSATDTNNNGLKVYEIENAWNNYIPAKIGLMYLHDYYLAYDNNRNWSNDYDTSNWIHFVNNKNTTGASEELLLSLYGTESFDFVCPPGSVCMPCGLDASWYHSISYVIDSTSTIEHIFVEGIARPTFYLSSTVKIKSGKGSITDPYIIEL